MTPADDFSAVPPFEIRASAEQRVPFVFNSPHSGRHYPERFLAMTQARPQGDPPLGGLLCRRAVRRRRAARRADAGREFSARLSRREPRALGTRPEHVRRAGAVLRQHPLGARGRRARHRAEAGRARGSTSIPAGCRWPKRVARIESVYKPYHDALKRLLTRTHARFGYAVLIDCHSMPASIRVGDNGRAGRTSSSATVSARRRRRR